MYTLTRSYNLLNSCRGGIKSKTTYLNSISNTFVGQGQGQGQCTNSHNNLQVMKFQHTSKFLLVVNSHQTLLQLPFTRISKITKNLRCETKTQYFLIGSFYSMLPSPFVCL